MAQALFETIFDVCYLAVVITLGIVMIRKGMANAPDNPQTSLQTSLLVRKFGWMAVVLGVGDGFHLLPRIFALWTTGLAANAASLGTGKLVTSLTMTAFYLMLYYIWQERYNAQGRSKLMTIMWIITAARVALCMFPQNEWLSYQPPLLWGILRNIPFATMGILIIILFAQEVKKANDRVFRFMPLAIALSFAFYIPVVLFSATLPLIGMLMIPKTLAYVWIVWMGWKMYRQGASR